MSLAGSPARAASASAPGRIELSGSAGGASVSIALDRRAHCRVEAADGGIELESKDGLTRTRAGDAEELVARAPGSVAAQVLAVLGAAPGLRLVTEWKLPAGSGVDGDSALAVAATAAVARVLGRDMAPDRLLALAREASARAGRPDSGGHEAAVWGGAVRRRGGPAVPVERLEADPGRIEEALLLVDLGPAAAELAATPAGAGAAVADLVADALAGGRYEEVTALVARESSASAPAAALQGLLELVQAAGGAARPLPGRLVAVWAPPGARGPGRREAVQAALATAGLKPMAIRVDLRGLEID